MAASIGAAQQVTQGYINELLAIPEKEKEEKLYAKSELGKDEFLQLLVTSLQHQDPMEPATNEEFIAQMAQFSELENSKNMVDSLEKLSTNLEGLVAQQQDSAAAVSGASATSLLGKKARVLAGEVDYYGQKEIKLNIHINDGEAALVSVLDEEGNTVYQASLDKENGTDGDHEFAWNGETKEGKKATPGHYSVNVTGFDGIRKVGYAYREDVVTGISYGESGVMLDIKGQAVPFENVKYVSNEKSE
jgi:flagellar basal-body rod modification protein FlgD